MTRSIPELQHVISREPFTTDSDQAFLYHLQRALLLALLERGRLSNGQYRHAEEVLNRQHTGQREAP